MKTLNNEEMIDLGAISVETRGIKQLGEPFFEFGFIFGLVGAISTDFSLLWACRRWVERRP